MSAPRPAEAGRPPRGSSKVAEPRLLESAASIFLPPWADLDDTALLAHYRAPRPVQYYPVADADETQPDKIDALLAGRFEFNGEAHDLHEPIAWLHNPSRDVEWHILLHKFYYAVGLGLAFERSGDLRYVQRWVGLIDSWMRVAPPGFIAADVTGRRVQNWIYSLHLFIGHAAHDTGAHITPAFHRRLLQSLHEQVEYLCANLAEKRNHRTLELYAIFLAGVVLPEMQRAAHWREFALEQTVANLQSDLLADGVHCELSTDYHHLVLKNALNFRRLAALNGVAVPAAFDDKLQRGLEFSLHVHKPDGSVPSLSDGDTRGFLDLLQQGAELFGRADMLYVATQGAQGTPPRERVAHFDSSGYSIVRSGWGDGATPFTDAQYLVFDSGPLGEGNHGHFDCLNFELAAFGRSLIVDPGRYTYSEAVDPADGINWRLHFRGTAAHNTVCVDGRQQTRYLPKPIKDAASRHASGSVRHKISGPAPDAGLVERRHGASLDLLHGRARSHEYDAQHERCIVLVDGCYWIVSDWLRAPAAHEYRLNFQLGARAQGQTTLSSGREHRLRSPGLLMLQPAREGMVTTLRPGWVSARYGHKQAAQALQSTVCAPNADFDTVLVPWSQTEPAFSVEHLAVEAGGAADGPLPRALRITLQAGGQSVVDTWFHARGRNAALWRIAGLEFSGRWAYWRHSADGRLLHAVSHAGASLPVPNSKRVAA
jgi:uncharacterized heparinase superfamily protein